MKVKVKTVFKDKYTGKRYEVGDELEMSVQRVNEVLKVGNFIELVEQEKEAPDQETEGADSAQDGVNQETEETPKQTGRRTKK